MIDQVQAVRTRGKGRGEEGVERGCGVGGGRGRGEENKESRLITLTWACLGAIITPLLLHGG